MKKWAQRSCEAREDPPPPPPLCDLAPSIISCLPPRDLRCLWSSGSARIAQPSPNTPYPPPLRESMRRALSAAYPPQVRHMPVSACPVCHAVFRTAAEAEQHVRACHDARAGPPLSWVVLYRCPHCPKLAWALDAIRPHCHYAHATLGPAPYDRLFVYYLSRSSARNPSHSLAPIRGYSVAPYEALAAGCLPAAQPHCSVVAELAHTRALLAGPWAAQPPPDGAPPGAPWAVGDDPLRRVLAFAIGDLAALVAVNVVSWQWYRCALRVPLRVPRRVRAARVALSWETEELHGPRPRAHLRRDVPGWLTTLPAVLRHHEAPLQVWVRREGPVDGI